MFKKSYDVKKSLGEKENMEFDFVQFFVYFVTWCMNLVLVLSGLGTLFCILQGLSSFRPKNMKYFVFVLKFTMFSKMFITFAISVFFFAALFAKTPYIFPN